MNEVAVREKTIREYICDLGRPELCHDYPAEVKRIIAMLDEKEERDYNAHEHEKVQMRKRMERMEVIIYSLAARLQYVDDSLWEGK